MKKYIDLIVTTFKKLTKKQKILIFGACGLVLMLMMVLILSTSRVKYVPLFTDLSLEEAAAMEDLAAGVRKKAREAFSLFEVLRAEVNSLSLAELAFLIVEKTKYLEYLSDQGPEGQTRVENVKELIGGLTGSGIEGVREFLDHVALITDLDEYEGDVQFFGEVFQVIGDLKGGRFVFDNAGAGNQNERTAPSDLYIVYLNGGAHEFPSYH